MIRSSCMLSAVAAAVVLVAACGEGLGGCVCTQEFRFYTLTVVDTAGQGVDSVSLTIRSQRTGRVFVPPGDLGIPFGPGTYLIFSDAEGADVADAGEPVRVDGTKGPATFTADFVFAPDGSCRCHVIKRSGPDTVTIR